MASTNTCNAYLPNPGRGSSALVEPVLFSIEGNPRFLAYRTCLRSEHLVFPTRPKERGGRDAAADDELPQQTLQRDIADAFRQVLSAFAET